MEFPFVKMHGAANDFVVVDHRAPFLPAGDTLTVLIARICDRRRGIGADGVLLLERDPECDFAMRYFNADGRDADYCGNGARCLVRRAVDLGLGRAGRLRFRTAVGVQEGRLNERGAIEVHFGDVPAPGRPATVEAVGKSFTGRLIRPGVPHFVIEVERVEWTPIGDWGPALRHHPSFAPEGANVDFIARLGSSRIAMRTWERGVEGETLACGSGAIASALAATAEQPAPHVTVLTAGGDELEVTIRANNDSNDVWLSGPAETVFHGTWTETATVEAGQRAGRA
jgi:diaminopimelate epimerase